MSHRKQIAELRREYARETLNDGDIAGDPIAQFARWFEEALNAGLSEPHAMTLATADATGRPSARIVLLKDYDQRGFTFFSNYDSRKGEDLVANPQAALLFHWVELERQVRVEGRVERVAPAESDEYWRSRPLGSRLGAWASPQSHVLAHREELEARLAEIGKRYGEDPPRPPHWGGYRLIPERAEFWQGRPNRLHDRVRYVHQGSEIWRIERLAP